MPPDDDGHGSRRFGATAELVLTTADTHANHVDGRTVARETAHGENGRRTGTIGRSTAVH